MSNEYWQDVTNKICKELDLGGQYFEIRNPDDITIDGSFDIEDIEKIVQMVKQAQKESMDAVTTRI